MTTMKLLLLSDSHGRVGSLLEAVDRELPDGAAHLGDVSRDAEALAAAYPDLPLWSVLGNCDGWGSYGHTHEPVAQLQSDGRWLINPGTAGGIGNRATYAVVQVEDGRLSVEIKEL